MSYNPLETMELRVVNEHRTLRIHSRQDCWPQRCPFHNPSNHKMNQWPIQMQRSTLLERICYHGVGHPDPDSVSYFRRRGVTDPIEMHGCDGCCHD